MLFKMPSHQEQGVSVSKFQGEIMKKLALGLIGLSFASVVFADSTLPKPTPNIVYIWVNNNTNETNLCVSYDLFGTPNASITVYSYKGGKLPFHLDSRSARYGKYSVRCFSYNGEKASIADGNLFACSSNPKTVTTTGTLSDSDANANAQDSGHHRPPKKPFLQYCVNR